MWVRVKLERHTPGLGRITGTAKQDDYNISDYQMAFQNGLLTFTPRGKEGSDLRRKIRTKQIIVATLFPSVEFEAVWLSDSEITVIDMANKTVLRGSPVALQATHPAGDDMSPLARAKATLDLLFQQVEECGPSVTFEGKLIITLTEEYPGGKTL